MQITLGSDTNASVEVVFKVDGSTWVGAFTPGQARALVAFLQDHLDDC